MRKLIIAAIIGAAVLLGTYGATMASGVLSHNTAQTDLTLTKSDSPDPVEVGEQLTYTLVATNNGPSTSTNVTLEDVLPDSVTFVSASATSGTCSESGGVVTCSIGTLLPDHSATVTIVVIADHVGEVVNSVEVSGDETDPNPGNNTASMTVSVVEVATEMEIVIRPGSDRNPLNLRGKGTLPRSHIGRNELRRT